MRLIARLLRGKAMMRVTPFKMMLIPLCVHSAFGLIWTGITHIETNAFDVDQIIVAAKARRILPSEVNLANLDAFEDQMRTDLPKGTAKRDVKKYLDKWNILYNLSYDGLSYYAAIENLGMRSVFRASLVIRIYLDADEEVDHLAFRVEYL